MMGGVVGASIVSGPAHQPHRPLQDLPDPRRRARRRRACGCCRGWRPTPRGCTTASGWPYSALGIGLVMPVLVLAVQNSVPPADLGTATSANNYFRQIGGSVGAAVFGTLFADRLADALADRLPARGRPARPRVHHPADWSTRCPPRCATATSRRTRTPCRGSSSTSCRCSSSACCSPSSSRRNRWCPTTPRPPSPSHRRPGARSADRHARPRPHGRRGTPSSLARVRRRASPVCGTVQHHDGTVVPRAALTLIDVAGRQIGRGASGDDGRYALSDARAPGRTS